MIKVVVHIAKAIIAITASMLFFSCGFETVDGTGNVLTQSRDTGTGFTEIDASGGIEVYVVQGNATSVKVEADSNLQELIVTKVSGKTLTIKIQKNIGNATSKKVTVTLPKVTAIESGSGVYLKTSNTLNADKITVSGSSGSNMEVTIAAKNAKIESSSGSNVTVKGKATFAETHSSSGSSLDAGALVAERVDAEASSGSNTTVNPIKSLKGDASSGSNILFIKTPDKLTKEESSGGRVSQK